jgi:L-ribulose-5-phosphate 4-epimerase
MTRRRSPAPAGGRATRALREATCAANIELFTRGLARFTFGNASGVDRERGLIVIKPSGVPYDRLTPAQMVVTDLEGRVVEGTLRPSSDLATHAALFRAFPLVGGVAPTHADYFHGAVPVTRPLSARAIASDYELNTGRAIVARFRQLDPMAIPAVLVAHHAPFTWGATVEAAVDHAAYLEEVALMAWHTLALAPGARPITRPLLDKHYLRKHGARATYGQRPGA